MNTRLKTYSSFFFGILIIFLLLALVFFVNPKISPKEIIHSRDNWVVMIDYSGSMVGGDGSSRGVKIDGKDIFDEARTALLDLLPIYLESDSLYEVYTFEEEPSKITSGIIRGKEDLSNLITQIRNLKRPSSSGTTCLSKALEVGSKISRKLSQQNDLPTRLLLITDGFDSPDKCPPLEQGVELGVTYILEQKSYIRLYPLGYLSTPDNNPFCRHCFFTLSSSKLKYSTIVVRAIFFLFVFGLIWHYIFLFFVRVSIRDRSNLNIIGGLIVWLFELCINVIEGRHVQEWQYGVVLLLHSIPASIFAYYCFCYLLHPLALFNGSILGLTILAIIRR